MVQAAQRWVRRGGSPRRQGGVARDGRVGKLGVSITAGRMTGFFEADGRSGGAYKGGAGRVGLKVSF